MAQDALLSPTATAYHVDDLVRDVLAGKLRIPAFQRPLKWQWEDALRLFDSIARGYPIGSLLLWERAANKETIRIGSREIKAPKLEAALWVVDGQQRITTLVSALTNPSDERFALAYDLEKKTFKKPGPRATSLVPLPTLFDLRSLLKWFAEHPEAEDHLDSASAMTKAIREYAVPTYVVRHSDEQTLRDIFDRMNNYGKRLTRAEVFSALHPIKEEGDSELTHIAEAIHARYRFGSIDEDTILRAMLARRGPDVTRDVRVEFNEKVRRDFDESEGEGYRGAEEALGLAVEFLQRDACVPHFAFLPYRYLLVVLTRFFAHHPSPKRRYRELLVRWFWRAALIGPVVSRGAYTSAMRAFAACIDTGDEGHSVDALLTALGDHAVRFVFPRGFKITMAEVRFVLCALWALGPRSMQSGEPYDQESLFAALEDAKTASNALELLFPKAAGARSRVGNRVFLLGEDAVDELRGGLEARPTRLKQKQWEKVLASHAIDVEGAALLRRGEMDAFLTRRERAIEVETLAFLERLAASKFEDTPPLDELDLDEEAADAPPDEDA